MSFNNARLQCHYAIQLNTRLARGFIPATDDDSHTSLGWMAIPGECHAGALVGQWVNSPLGRFRLGVSLANLTLLLLDASCGQDVARMDTFSLDQQTLGEAQGWLSERLKARGLDPGALSRPLHFTLDDDPLAHGARFSIAGTASEFEAFAQHFKTAAALLEEICARDPRSSPVRCWPHHFDIATLITLAGSGERARTIGIGLSPGDRRYPEPYYYVSPYPYPDPAWLPELPNGGFWNTDGWTGAVLRADSLSREALSSDAIRGFLEDAIRASESLQGMTSREPISGR